jgi:hypothetical protein
MTLWVSFTYTCLFNELYCVYARIYEYNVNLRIYTAHSSNDFFQHWVATTLFLTRVRVRKAWNLFSWLLGDSQNLFTVFMLRILHTHIQLCDADGLSAPLWFKLNLLSGLFERQSSISVNCHAHDMQWTHTLHLHFIGNGARVPCLWKESVHTKHLCKFCWLFMGSLPWMQCKRTHMPWLWD